MSARLLVIGCMLAVLAGPSHGTTREMWVWVDAQGVRHFSDRPVPGAQLMTISAPPPSAEPRPPSPAGSSSAASASRRNTPSAVQYELFEVFEPENGQSFFGADTVVNVRMRSEPDLAEGDVTRLYLDGRLVEGQPRGLEYSLSSLDRGAHSMIAMIVDSRGNERIRSAPVVFHIRQASVNAPANVGPNLRPQQPAPPRPTPRPGGG
jgi:hypothetical protein